MNNICGDVLIFFAIAISFFNCCYAKNSYAYVRQNDENRAVRKFRDYLKIQTVHPDPKDGYRLAVDWLRNQADELELEYNFLDLGPVNEFALWMTWSGTNPELKSILFNTHMDVVPADPEKWIHPPFEAYKDSQGNIYARGATDMKSATVAILEAIRILKQEGFQPLRNVHLMIMPEEEKGGFRGVTPFLDTEQFKSLNVALDIDEGGVNPEPDTIAVWYTEKAVWQFNISATGEAGHGSTLPQYTAGQRLQVVIQKLFEFREEQYKLLENPDITVDQLTVLNLVQLGGGFAENIIPNEVWATFDMRVRLRSGWNSTDVENMLMSIVQDAHLGPDLDPSNKVYIKFIAKTMETGETATNHSNIWWTVLEETCNELNVTCKPTVPNAASDGRLIRDRGIPTFGFGPFLNTPFTAHQDNEMINESEFLLGIDRYVKLIRNLATTQEHKKVD